MIDLTPRAVVGELDRFIIGQQEAKKTIAVALCNRERRRRVSVDVGKRIVPKNILLSGPTGVGKTEIARRMADIIDAPFLKVDATKFTEVGYVGRDVESIVHDLVDVSVNKLYQSSLHEMRGKAERKAVERIINYLCHQMNPKGKKQSIKTQKAAAGVSPTECPAEGARPRAQTRRRVAELLQKNELEEQLIEIEVETDFEGGGPLFSPIRGLDDIEGILGEFDKNLRQYSIEQRRRTVSVKEARRILAREEANKLIDFDQLVEEGAVLSEESAVVFIDEIDKLISPRMEMGRDVSGEGVQRDLLPLVEGTTVITRYGAVNTDHILFVAAGTFSHGKPADLLPELQSRFPLRVEMDSLREEDLERVLVEPEDSLIKQYQALLETEGVRLTLAEEGVHEVAHLAALMNEKMQDIGARRLHAVVEKVLEEINFTAPERRGDEVVVDAEYVSQRARDLVDLDNTGRYIL
ncbi:MAG: ATP-dependent protease ATPase subunit HslU [Chloroflexota bacterium]|nr:ATP-dependent protease ATPase subunit HslU [Chloroflexota bacterium]